MLKINLRYLEYVADLNLLSQMRKEKSQHVNNFIMREVPKKDIT